MKFPLDQEDVDSSSGDDGPESLPSSRKVKETDRPVRDRLQINGDDIASTSDSDDSEGSREEDMETELEAQVADMPFEVLQRMQSDGSGARTLLRGRRPKDLKRLNKNRPQELPSKRPVTRFREVIQAPKKEFRDPRFESLCGTLDEDRFKTSYSFLFNEQLPAERQRLQKVLKKERDPERRKDIQTRLKATEQELRSEEQRRRVRDVELQQKRGEKAAVQQGKKPFFPKKSDVRKQVLLEKYKQLKAAGKLDAFLSKRRKRNAAKEHTKIPFRRGGAGE